MPVSEMVGTPLVATVAGSGVPWGSGLILAALAVETILQGIRASFSLP